ncbi:hypothetical protein [Microbacterium invictum]|uniref:Small-conductance mechanosensitive channel n=1 Tax=Microbacterium invictum TaxID=515415 RepID=A0AA40SQS1_9MICO|nr:MULTISPECIES: hypothetical protein [Microbacterium]MBB4140532.1 small-conductance mechanosensitive channel [Microbacterium invictum]
MIDHDFPRDLVMTAAIFGVAAFIWSGWAQEKPPHWVWRVVLAVLSLTGIAMAAINIPIAIRAWDTATAIDFGGSAWTAYLVVFAIEIVAIIGLAIWAAYARRTDQFAPLVLAVVGIHFIPLAFVFGQVIIGVVGVVLAFIAVLAALLPVERVARSFWCGILAAPVLLIAGAVCAVAGRDALV